jgi:TolA-binding protein
VNDLTPILLPVIVAVILSVSGAFVVSRFSSPAQSAYVAALEGRMKVLQGERDDATARLPHHEQRIAQLEAKVAELEVTNRRQAQELLELYRRLDADERRMEHDERLLPKGGAR